MSKAFLTGVSGFVGRALYDCLSPELAHDLTVALRTVAPEGRSIRRADIRN